MLRIMVGAREGFDERTQEFVNIGGTPLELEHSLVSLSKWEQTFEKPFLSEDKTPEETLAYVRAMVLTEEVPEEVFSELTEDNLKQIHAYIDKKMSATFFNDLSKSSPNREVLTSELIYYMMTVYNIPFETERWHLNRLFTLIRVHGVKQAAPKKMSPADRARQMREMNAARQKQYNTTG